MNNSIITTETVSKGPFRWLGQKIKQGINVANVDPAVMNITLRKAVIIKDIELMKLSKQLGATEFKIPINYAYVAGSREVFNLCRLWHIDKLLLDAAKKGDRDEVLSNLKSDAKDIKGAIECAELHGHQDIVELCRLWQL